MVETLLEIAAPLLTSIMEKLGKSFSRQTKLREGQIESTGKLLSGRLVYLLRYMDEKDYPVYPHAFGRVLASFVEVERVRQPAQYVVEAEEAWDKASEYACYYLSMLGLISIYGGMGGEVVINEFGKELIRSEYIKRSFRNVFNQPLNL